jgi:hypothetical protein
MTMLVVHLWSNFLDAGSIPAISTKRPPCYWQGCFVLPTANARPGALVMNIVTDDIHTLE